MVNAFYTLTREIGSDTVELHVAGYLGKKDEPYFEELVNQINSWGLRERFVHFGEVNRTEKIEFFNRLHIFSVPTVYRESKGLSILEALANGVPVVQPQHGSFPEMIKATQGGILVEPESSDALAEGILQLFRDPVKRKQLGIDGKRNVHEKFNDGVIAQQLMDVFQKYI